MNNIIDDYEAIKETVTNQLNNYWSDYDETVIEKAIPETIRIIKNGIDELSQQVLSPYVSVQWMVFLYRLAHQIYVEANNGVPKEADQIYYLNKIMHANDWFYAIDLPIHFRCEHPLGSVLGRAKYGDYLFVYQGTTVGGNRSKGKLSYPSIGDNVIMYANSTILGDSQIGNNVVIAAETFIINGIIPDNCIVFGKSPNLTIERKTEQEIKAYTEHIWKW